MGSYTFKWEHPANEVFVTGTFDDWGKTVKLDKEDGIFQKTVQLPKEKVQYKFVVDGNWVTNDSAPGEHDHSNNYNNILSPDDIKESPIHTLSSAAPTSTTAGLAGAVPKEEKTKSEESIPGAFPETPAAEKTLSINPIPATAGAGNPIHLEPGEKVPHPSTFTSNTVSSTAKTDPASYEKSDAQPPQLGPVVTPDAERQANGGMFGIPAISNNLIPESSLPIGSSAKEEKDPGVTIQSAHPTSTTAALAGQVPKEPRGVPAAVTESQKEANFPPEASANPAAVEEKKELEAELKEKVPEEPPTAESSVTGKAAATATAGATAAAGAFAGATYAAKDTAAKTLGLNEQATAGSEVPPVVKESQDEANAAPEASASPVAVQEKTAVEEELLKKVPEEPPAAESSITEKAAVAAGVGATAAAGAVVGAKETAEKTLGVSGTTSEVPEAVKESQQEAHVAPEASANPEAVAEKAAVESELLKEVKTTNESGEPAPTVTAETSETAPGLSPNALADDKPLKSSSEPDALNASADKPAVPATAAVETPSTPSKPAVESRDISPKTEQPAVTTGATSTTAEPKTEAKSTPETAPETPKKTTAPESAKGTPESIAESSNTADKKKKRRSIFGKLKDKFNKH